MNIESKTYTNISPSILVIYCLFHIILLNVSISNNNIQFLHFHLVSLPANSPSPQKVFNFFQFNFYCPFNFQSLTRKENSIKNACSFTAVLEASISVNSTISNWAFNFVVKYRLPCNYNSRVWIKVYIIKLLYRGAIKGILN